MEEENLDVLKLSGISKSFGRNQVLSNVDFTLREGEIHALMGENGAGKSTLMNIVYGLLKPDTGKIWVSEEEVLINDIRDAQKLGICFVHQEIALCQDVTVAENIFMAKVNDANSIGFNRKKMVEEAKIILQSLVNDAIDPEKIVANLSISQQQVVEIARAISNECKILILDEPTAALSSAESNALYQVMQTLKKKGIGIVYISHRMAEIFDQCDKVSVLRDGMMISSYDIKDAQVQSLVNDMAGREIDMLYPQKAKQINYEDENILLNVKDLTDVGKRFSNISFKLYKGEILGFSGMLGSGRSEIMSAIVGLRKAKSGQVVLKGKNITKLSTQIIFEAGLVLLPEDRKKLGLFLDMDIDRNISANYLNQVCIKGWLRKKKEEDQSKNLIKDVNVRCTSGKQLVRNLSGGNQQKVLIAKVLAKQPDVLIVDEPTRGIDVGAKAEVHRLLRKLAQAGVGIIMVSSELNEILGMSDRVVLINSGGEAIKEVQGDDINADHIMYYVSGAYKYKESIK